MVQRVVQHIPEKHFRMVRYYGFLANRVCGQLLPRVYHALAMEPPVAAEPPRCAQMFKRLLRDDPFSCILCAGRMVFSHFTVGLRVHQLLANTLNIALMRPVQR